jgi:phosphatidylserine/phosphatidylglycerophosphate/cardiolipin synthase-like enzyme
MNAAIAAAANRGVKVYVMVASVTSFGKLSDTADRAKIQHWTDTFQAFDQAGVNSKIFDSEMNVGPKPGYLHAKVILVDGEHAWVGSVNGSTESLSVNREFGIFSDDPNFVRHLSSVLYADFNDSKTETWQQSLDCAKDACGSGHTVRPRPESPSEDTSSPDLPTSPKPTRPHAPHKPKPPHH